MSPWRGGRGGFEVSLEDVAGPRIVVGLAGAPRPQRFSQGGWGMPGDPGWAEPDCPSAIEVLADQDSLASIALLMRAWGDIDDQAAEADRVVVGHRGLVGEGDLDGALGGGGPG